MSCPDWTQLTRNGEHVPAAAWAHTETCDHCRGAALEADPTMVFRRLPQVDVTMDDITQMQQAVAAMRRGKTVEAKVGSGRGTVVPLARRRVAPMLQTVGLAAAALMAMLLPARLSSVPDEVPAPAPALASVAQDDTAWLRAQLANEPPMESAEGLEVIQIANDDVDLVVIVGYNTEVTSLDV